MTNRIEIFPPPVFPGGRPARNPANPGKDFTTTLQEVQGNRELHFSAHARERLRQRDLSLGAGVLAKIGEAMDRLRQKGGSSSLLLYGDMALVASVKNNTIVTAMDRRQLREHVFTGIDSAAIILD